MRAPPLLLALLAAAAPQPPKTTSQAPPPTPGLLILRAACSFQDPAVFTSPAPIGLRVLSYEETCSPGWRERVTRAALATMSSGGTVTALGWPGAPACDVLSAAARALHVPRPPACALASARAAAVARLAARRGWRRVSLPLVPARSECRATLHEVARALPPTDSLNHASHLDPSHRVEVRCVSRTRGMLGAVHSAPALLLLHVEEPDIEPTPSSDGARHRANETDHPFLLSKRQSSSDTDEKGNPRPGLDLLFSSVDDLLPRRELLLLSEESRREDEEESAWAKAAPIDTARFTFYVWHRAPAAASWSLIGTVRTESTAVAEDSHDWVTEVRESGAFERRTGGEERSEGNAENGAVVEVVAVCGAVVLAGSSALAARWVRARRRRRRRTVDAVLDPRDFSFPADGRRCVGDGMETMVSCWLQRLHEFGGPELERRPSAPSSGCGGSRAANDRRVTYKGDAVHVKVLSAGGAPSPDLRRKTIDVLLLMRGLRHENLNPFIGWLDAGELCGAPALVWTHCGRGSLQDVLRADDIRLDWTFRLSLLTDLVRGMRYLHASPLRVHGRLSSRNCCVDARWVLRVTDYGLGAVRRAQALPSPPVDARDLLWTAPELLRSPDVAARGSQPGDVYSFAIIMQEVIVRGEPYCMLPLSAEEIVEKLIRPPPLVRPSVSLGAAPPEAVSLMRQCWSEAPDSRPDFARLYDLFRPLHRGRKMNIVDSMFEMLEKYSNNLEELIKERTEQLDMEKKKTEQLLNRMLPKSVAERLLSGARVEPEEFSEVTVYFSDIVGFTALAARSSPVEVALLLNDLYTTFDGAIEQHRVYKVETIGDAYMVVGGLPARATDHAESVATMALHLLHLAGRFRVRHLPDTPLHLRIGLHSGACCAAVVGTTMPRYCLFGDTVNTASRMESTGAAWRIQVSGATAARLAAAGGYLLQSRGLVGVKGKGAMHTYWLLGKDGFDKPLPTPPPLASDDALLETEGENESKLSSRSLRSPVPVSTPEAVPPLAASVAVAPAVATPAAHLNPADQGVVSAESCLVEARQVAGERYRWGSGRDTPGAALQYQRSLDRGETLTTVEDHEPASLPLPTGPDLRVPPPPRYRTRPDPPDEPLGP